MRWHGTKVVVRTPVRRVEYRPVDARRDRGHVGVVEDGAGVVPENGPSGRIRGPDLQCQFLRPLQCDGRIHSAAKRRWEVHRASVGRASSL